MAFGIWDSGFEYESRRPNRESRDRVFSSGWEAGRSHDLSREPFSVVMTKEAPGRETVVSLARPSYWGKRKLKPQVIVV
jgi:hypothetical protein